MTDILLSILNMSAAASIAAIAVIIARLPLAKAPKIFSYALWAVVFLRLACPVSFESPASFMPVNAEIIPRSVVYEPVMPGESGVPIVGEPLNQFAENSLPEAEPAASADPVQAALSIAAYVWLLGTAALLSYAAVGYIRLKRRVYDATIECGNVYRTEKAATAFVLGLVRPKIYIPLNISGTQLEHILRHERVHIKRCDYLIKPLAFIILAVHWFNPLAWISYYFMSKDMEMSCDEAVLRNSAADMRQDYSTSLVNLYTRKPALLSPLAFGEGSYNNMKARIKNVLNFKRAPRWAAIVCLFVLMIFAVGFATNPPQNGYVDARIDGILNTAFAKFGEDSIRFPVHSDSNANNASTLKQEPVQYLAVYAHADDGTWAVGTGIEGDTRQSQIDSEIEWFNDIYAKEKADFAITEALPATDVTDTARLRYLYDNSEVFRNMSAMADGDYFVESGDTFYRSGDSLTTDIVYRTAIMADNNGDLTLDINYSLEQGKMAVWLIDPDGNMVYQGDLGTAYKGTQTITGKKGLWSVACVYEGGDDSEVSGNAAISLHQDNGSESNH